MENLLPLLAVMACPIGMGLCMWLMARGMGHSGSKEKTPTLDELRAQQRRLESEIDSLERAQSADEPLVPR